jgi:hypothetical protein
MLSTPALSPEETPGALMAEAESSAAEPALLFPAIPAAFPAALPPATPLPLAWPEAWWQLVSWPAAVVLPGLSRLPAPVTWLTGTWTPRTLTGTVSLQAWSGTWLWLMLATPALSPDGLVEAMAAGAHMPITPAVTAATAKARLFPDIVILSMCLLIPHYLCGSELAGLLVCVAPQRIRPY